MSLAELIGFGAYAASGFVVAIRVGVHQAWRMFRLEKVRYPSLSRGTTEPDGEQWFGGMLMGSLAGLIWPLFAAVYLFRGRLLAPPRDIQLQRSQARIAELERELNL